MIVHIIKNPSEEVLRRRKFSIMFRNHVDYWLEIFLAEIISIFAPRYLECDVVDMVRMGYFEYEKSHQKKLSGDNHCSCYIINRDVGYRDCIVLSLSGGEGIFLCESLAGAYQKCIDKLVVEKMVALGGLCAASFQVQRHHFFFSDGFIELFIQYGNFCPMDVDDVINELVLRRKYIMGVANFLRQEVGLDESSEVCCIDALEEWVYNKIVSDPLAYINPAYGFYNAFAKSLI